jgi:hypothetical protein
MEDFYEALVETPSDVDRPARSDVMPWSILLASSGP